jgi:hypothetical protein
MCALVGKLSEVYFPRFGSTVVHQETARGEHKTFCVLDSHVNESVVSVQRHFQTKFWTDPPSGTISRHGLHLQTKIDWTSVDRGRSSGACPHKLRKEPSEIHLPGKRRTWYPAENCVAGSVETFANKTIPSAVASSSEVIDHDMLQRVWQELGYQFDVCCVMGGAYIEHM